jgi:hypothetical protein
MEVGMLRFSVGLLGVAALWVGATAPARPFAWPHRIVITSRSDRAVSFRAFTVGGELPITVDEQGRFTQSPSGMPRIVTLTEKDTVRAVTPGDFYVDVGKGPIVLIADDSIHVVAGFNPYGSSHQVWADGRRLTIKLIRDQLFIDTK